MLLEWWVSKRRPALGAHVICASRYRIEREKYCCWRFQTLIATGVNNIWNLTQCDRILYIYICVCVLYALCIIWIRRYTRSTFDNTRRRKQNIIHCRRVYYYYARIQRYVRESFNIIIYSNHRSTNCNAAVHARVFASVKMLTRRQRTRSKL